MSIHTSVLRAPRKGVSVRNNTHLRQITITRSHVYPDAPRIRVPSCQTQQTGRYGLHDPSRLPGQRFAARPDRTGSVRACASKCRLRSDGQARSIRRLPGWPLRSQCDGGSGASGYWQKYVGKGGNADGAGYAIHRSLDRTGQPIVGT
jgi:hypothetical protein